MRQRLSPHPLGVDFTYTYYEHVDMSLQFTIIFGFIMILSSVIWKHIKKIN